LFRVRSVFAEGFSDGLVFAQGAELATLSDSEIAVTTDLARSQFIKSLRGRLTFLFISKVYRQVYADTGISTDSARVARRARWARWLAKPCRKLFSARPMPDLQIPEVVDAQMSRPSREQLTKPSHDLGPHMLEAEVGLPPLGV
jgi:hypothetical protein